MNEHRPRQGALHERLPRLHKRLVGRELNHERKRCNTCVDRPFKVRTCCTPGASRRSAYARRGSAQAAERCGAGLVNRSSDA